MEIFVHDTDWHDQFASVEEYVAARGIAEGEEFSLIRLTVGANTTYRVKDGKAVPESVAFPNALPPLDDIENSDQTPKDERIENPAAELAVDVLGAKTSSDETICPKCRGVMHKGLAIEETFTGTPEWRGAEICTMSPGGPGRMIGCLKCGQCGYSVTE